MQTTIKVTKETRNRLSQLDLSDKNKTFDAIINELMTFYQKSQKKYVKDYKNWERAFKRSEEDWKRHERELTNYEKNKEQFNKLLKWAKSKGFKG